MYPNGRQDRPLLQPRRNQSCRGPVWCGQHPPCSPPPILVPVGPLHSASSPRHLSFKTKRKATHEVKRKNGTHTCHQEARRLGMGAGGACTSPPAAREWGRGRGGRGRRGLFRDSAARGAGPAVNRRHQPPLGLGQAVSQGEARRRWPGRRRLFSRERLGDRANKRSLRFT